MKLFTKLALVSAVAVSGSAMAMESMDDSALSSTTGQEGITLGIEVNKVAIANLYVHDNDGLKDGTLFNGAAASTVRKGVATGGAITVNGVTISANPGATGQNLVTLDGGAYVPGKSTALLAKLNIDADGGDGTADGSTGAFLNINAQVSGLEIDVASIGVAQSKTMDLAVSKTVRGVVDVSKKEIITGLNIKTGKMDANIQLGSTPQGHMITLRSKITGGLEISGLSINDAANGGSIIVDKINIADFGSNDLTANADIDVTTKGLKITAGSNATNVYVKGVYLGTKTVTPAPAASSNSIGDIEISNMRVWNGAAGNVAGIPTAAANGAVIHVSGH